jgi:hypothetical protein
MATTTPPVETMIRVWAAKTLAIPEDAIRDVHWVHEDGGTSDSGTYWPAHFYAQVSVPLDTDVPGRKPDEMSVHLLRNFPERGTLEYRIDWDAEDVPGLLREILEAAQGEMIR